MSRNVRKRTFRQEGAIWTESSVGAFCIAIKKTRLFKYIENFSTKTERLQIRILIFFTFLLKTWIVGTR